MIFWAILSIDDNFHVSRTLNHQNSWIRGTQRYHEFKKDWGDFLEEIFWYRPSSDHVIWTKGFSFLQFLIIKILSCLLQHDCTILFSLISLSGGGGKFSVPFYGATPVFKLSVVQLHISYWVYTPGLYILVYRPSYWVKK